MSVTQLAGRQLFNNSVTYAKIQQVGIATLVGNPTGSAANASEITLGASLVFSGSSLGFNISNSNQWTAVQQFTRGAIGTTPTDSIALFNNNAAGVGAQQISPSLHWSGTGWKTATTAGSQPVDFIAYILPVQGVSAPTGLWKLQSSINSGGFVDVFSVDNTGIGLFANGVGATYINLSAATTTIAPINLTSSVGVNISSPIDGMLWYNGTNLNFRQGSTTKDLLASGGTTYSADGTSLTLTGTVFSINVANNNIWTALQVFNASALGTITTASATFLNGTAATVGAQQVSPSTVWGGNGWKTTATAASQPVTFQAYVLPVQGAAAPSANWILQSSINNGTYSTVFSIDNNGNPTFGNAVGNVTLTLNNLAEQFQIKGVASNGMQYGAAGGGAGFYHQFMDNSFGTILARIFNTGNYFNNKTFFGGSTTATAFVHIAAGTATVAPFQLISGTNLTTVLAGAVEFNGTNLFFSPTSAARLSVAMNSTAAAPATTGTVAAVFTNISVMTIVPTGACTINASGGITGQEVILVVTTSGTSSFVLTFNTNFKSTGTLTTGTVTGKVFTISFVYDGTNYNETSRTTAM